MPNKRPRSTTKRPHPTFQLLPGTVSRVEGKRSLLKEYSKTTLKTSLFKPLGVAPIPVQIAVGVASASYWRGVWYILDDNLFPDNPKYSASASLVLGTGGLAFVQGMMEKQALYAARTNSTKLPRYYSPFARFGTLYCVATSCVLVWRGAWMGCDILYEKIASDAKATDPGHLTKSGVASHVLATCGLLAFGRFSSVLGPPARGSILEDLTLKATTWQQYSKAAKWFFK